MHVCGWAWNLMSLLGPRSFLGQALPQSLLGPGWDCTGLPSIPSIEYTKTFSSEGLYSHWPLPTWGTSCPQGQKGGRGHGAESLGLAQSHGSSVLDPRNEGEKGSGPSKRGTKGSGGVLSPLLTLSLSLTYSSVKAKKDLFYLTWYTLVPLLRVRGCEGPS